MGADSMVTDEFWAITGPAGEGTLLTFGPDPRLNPANAALVRSFRAAVTSRKPTHSIPMRPCKPGFRQRQSTLDGHDQGERALRANTFDTVKGQLGFNAKGDVLAPAMSCMFGRREVCVRPIGALDVLALKAARFYDRSVQLLVIGIADGGVEFFACLHAG